MGPVAKSAVGSNLVFLCRNYDYKSARVSTRYCETIRKKSATKLSLENDFIF